DERADVRNDPVVARLDEQVASKLLDVVVNGAEHLLDERQIRLELAGRGGIAVANPVDLRQALVQRNARGRHQQTFTGGVTADKEMWMGAIASIASCAHGIVAASGLGGAGRTSVAGSSA